MVFSYVLLLGFLLNIYPKYLTSPGDGKTLQKNFTIKNENSEGTYNQTTINLRSLLMRPPSSIQQQRNSNSPTFQHVLESNPDLC